MPGAFTRKIAGVFAVFVVIAATLSGKENGILDWEKNAQKFKGKLFVIDWIPTSHASKGLLFKKENNPTILPEKVKKAIAAADSISGMPYKTGGGRDEKMNGFDCSGTTSFVLMKAGILAQPLTSKMFANYGEPGPGQWITVCARPGHVFLIINEKRFDAQGQTPADGPRWHEKHRSLDSFSLRHPKGL